MVAAFVPSPTFASRTAVPTTLRHPRKPNAPHARPPWPHEGGDDVGSFADIGKSGWDPDVTRPGFADLMDAVRAGQVDIVLVFALSSTHPTRRGGGDDPSMNYSATGSRS